MKEEEEEEKEEGNLKPRPSKQVKQAKSRLARSTQSLTLAAKLEIWKSLKGAEIKLF